MQETAIYRCVFGDYDVVRPERIVIGGADYYLFTDDPSLQVYPYRTVLVQDVSCGPSLTNRKLKIVLPPIMRTYDVTIYMDGNIVVLDDFSSLIEEYFASDADIGLFRHPYHDSLEDELELCVASGKCDEKALRRELSHYSAMSLSDWKGLSENSILMRRRPSRRMDQAMSHWFDLVSSYTGRDQICLPLVRAKYQLREHFFRFSPRSLFNPYFVVYPHKHRNGSFSWRSASKLYGKLAFKRLVGSLRQLAGA